MKHKIKLRFRISLYFQIHYELSLESSATKWTLWLCVAKVYSCSLDPDNNFMIFISLYRKYFLTSL